MVECSSCTCPQVPIFWDFSSLRLFPLHFGCHIRSKGGSSPPPGRFHLLDLPLNARKQNTAKRDQSFPHQQPTILQEQPHTTHRMFPLALCKGMYICQSHDPAEEQILKYVRPTTKRTAVGICPAGSSQVVGAKLPAASITTLLCISYFLCVFSCRSLTPYYYYEATSLPTPTLQLETPRLCMSRVC